MVSMAAAGRVAVGVGIDTILDEDDESSAEAIEKNAAAARADTNLMENMVCGCEEVGM